MSQAPPEQSYIRGVGATSVDARRVLPILGGVVALGLVAVTVYLFVATADRNSSATRLRSQGRSVEATVTTCKGISDGIGMGVVYYQCTGTASLDGQTYQGVIQGSRAERASGSQVAAVVVPGETGSLTLASSAAAARKSSYTPDWVMAVVSLVAAALAVWLILRRRRSGRSQPGPETQPAKP